MTEIRLQPIGVVRSPRTEAEDDYWGAVVSTIELDATRFGPDSLMGLDQFSHLEVIFYMHMVSPDKIQVSARHPRNRADWPMVGIFAQRAKGRPNQLGVSRCRLLRVEGTCLTVQALDAIEGTPVLDIKPYMVEFGPHGEVRQPAWSNEVMSRYYDDHG